MTTVGQGISLVKCARLSLRLPTLLSMCVLTTSLWAAVSSITRRQTNLLPPVQIVTNPFPRAASHSNPIREVELDVEIGADARDWSSIQAQEKLKPVETDLRRIEEMVSDIVTEMEYLRAREQRLRDTNESTNERVKWFAFGTMGMLVGLGAWQVVYLRAYFRSKHLI